jgi:hypothetical protein
MNTTSTNETTTDADALRRAKVEALQQRRAGAAAATSSPAAARGHRPSRRKSVAQGSKIAATALGVTAMLGMVYAMGAAANNATAAAATAPAAAAAPAQVVVVIHPAAGTGVAAAATATANANAGAVQAASTQPIALSAQPTVRQAPASQAPAATSRGSK